MSRNEIHAVAPDPEKREGLLLPLLREHATCGTSYAALRPEVELLVSEGGGSAVPFLRTGDFLLAIGDPLCHPEARLGLAEQFLLAAAAAGKRPAFFPVSESFRAVAADLGFVGIEAAGEPVIRLETYDPEAPGRRQVRTAARKAAGAGVSYSIIHGQQLRQALREELGQVEALWQESRGAGVPALLTAPDPFRAVPVRRYGVARLGGAAVAFASLVPLPACGGWMVDGLFRRPGAPAGTSECLLSRLAEQLRDEGFSLLSLGPSVLAVSRPDRPADGDVQQESGVAKAVLRWMYAHAPELLNYRSAHRFKRKFARDDVIPLFLLSRSPVPDADLLLALLTALFLGFDFKGLIHELWHRLSSDSVAGALLPDREV